MENKTHENEALIKKIIFDIAQAHKDNVVIKSEYMKNPVKDILLKHKEKQDLSYSDIISLCNGFFKKSQEITNLLYQTCFELQEDYIIYSQQHIESQTNSLYDIKKQIYSVNDILEMKDIFGMKTKNTIIKKLNNGGLKGKQVNGKWQIQRNDLVDFVGHDNFD